MGYGSNGKKLTRKRRKFGLVQKKLLSCILAGVAISMSRSPTKQWKILTKDLPKEFAKINMQSAEYGLHRLYKSKYIGLNEKDGGVYFPYLTKEGKTLAREYDLENLAVEIPKVWDKKWRFVMFDIPEKFKRRRSALRFHLQRLGFRHVHKSVYALPFECGEEIMKIVEFLGIRKFVCYAAADEVSEAPKLKFAFGL